MSPLARLLAAAALLATVGSTVQAADDGPLTRGECAGPHVDHVVVGDYRHGVPDRVIGATPTIMAEPGTDKVGQLTAGTAYTIVDLQHGYALLRGTRFSKPFTPGATVGWVKVSELHFLMLRNCL